MRLASLAMTALLGLSLTSCKSKNEAGGAAQVATGDWSVPSDVKLEGQPVTIAGVTFRTPSDWNDLGPSGMRKANYTYGPTGGDKDSATMAVFYFGQGQGGGIKDNIERWINQMSLPDGSDPHVATTQSERTVDGMTVHWVELAGTYSASMGGMMSGASEQKTGYRMAAVVLEAPEGNLFFKLTGPDATAKEMIGAFKAMILDIKKAN
ncbi:MAG: hypothetical protein AB1644_04140 [Candidatus Zixiibacteriota bacterium]